MHQIDCRLGLCPRPTGGAYIAPPDPLAGSGVGPTGNGKERGEKRREGRGGEGGERTGREGRASRNKGGSKGAGGSMPPVVSVCNIFFARGCWRSDIPRSLHPSALSTEGVGITPPLPNPNLGSATLQQAACFGVGASAVTSEAARILQSPASAASGST